MDRRAEMIPSFNSSVALEIHPRNMKTRLVSTPRPPPREHHAIAHHRNLELLARHLRCVVNDGGDLGPVPSRALPDHGPSLVLAHRTPL